MDELDEGGFRYEIVSERGSDYARNKVLKAVLKREQELIAEGRGEAIDVVSARNYEFTDAAADADGVRYVLLKPKRKDVLLVDGRMVLNEDATELLRVEGRLSKNPSFWTNSVNVIRHYGRLDGVRVPVSTESIARVKFAGLSRLEVQLRLRVDQRPPRKPRRPPHAHVAPVIQSSISDPQSQSSIRNPNRHRRPPIVTAIATLSLDIRQE